MKKVLMVFLVIGVVAAVAVRPVWSQDRKVTFSLNAGLQTNIGVNTFIWPHVTSFGKAWLTLDARVGLSLGKSFEISPEVMAVFNWGWGWGGFDTDEGGLLLYPGVLVNYRIGGFFVGAGAALPIEIESEAWTGNIAPKINIGYRSGHFQATAFFIVWTEEGLGSLDMSWAGITLGFRF